LKIAAPESFDLMTRAVFLDRDGVVNRAILRDGKPYPPETLADLRVLPGVREACRKLREAGFALILITNQPDIARGGVSAEQVADINGRLQQYLQLDDVRVCPHDDADRCFCRKPKPGLLLRAAQRWNIDLASSYIVGDRWRDVEAGQRAGCQPVFIDYGYRERRPDGPYVQVRSLREAANWILQSAQARMLRYA
jgi:D-glycero-D-manno-heptose 1,7-bisphosphate phosphatase